jgi:Mn-containing catalase
MYHHVKKLMYTVRVDEPDPRFGNMLLEQFGGANGELAAAMQYSIQGLNCEDAARKDLLMDIGTEELSHLEIVGCLARMHLKPLKSVREEAEADPLIAIAGGGGVNLFNSQGNPWTADYLKITGELDVDLRSNIAAEARAKIVYERLIDLCRDAGTKDALQFLMTREITHMRRSRLHLRPWASRPSPSGVSRQRRNSLTSSLTTPRAKATTVRSIRADRGTRGSLGSSSSRRLARMAQAKAHPVSMARVPILRNLGLYKSC